MLNRRENTITISTIAGLSLLSFFICLLVFNNSHTVPSGVKLNDSLSGEEYFTGDVYNYREANPYGSYFVGFDNLTDAGITHSDMVYINDVITNYVMYDKKIYNGKISYVKDSFKHQDDGDDNSYRKYSFQFGINDGNITTVNVTSSWVKREITITLVDDKNHTTFNKKFIVSVD